MKKLIMCAFLLVVCSNVLAIDFETIRGNMGKMTDASWDKYVKEELIGEKVSWKGWVSDVKSQTFGGGYKVLIDMDPPGSMSVQDIYVEDVDESIALNMNKQDKVGVSGTIVSVYDIFGSCAVTLKNVVFTYY
jgi:divalent metal cation (Fe/Co/Zn/Cd) transporter